MQSLQITPDDITVLRCSLNSAISSEKRRQHILGVEKAAAELAKIYLPEKLLEIRAAALLHDITKEWKTEKHIEFAALAGQPFTTAEQFSPKVLHAKTASLLIPTEYPKFNTPEIVSAVRKHTTGHPAFSLFDKIIFLADFIEEGRTYELCQRIRREFWGNLPNENPMKHLDLTVLKVLDETIGFLIRESSYIAEDTLLARNFLLVKTAQYL